MVSIALFLLKLIDTLQNYGEQVRGMLQNSEKDLQDFKGIGFLKELCKLGF
ncbi:MAG TPA: hypothetical protein VEC36_08690 [Patescibacteria group bacterium]|nr:hypothetical protein [Patescibacteria group bacterium]